MEYHYNNNYFDVDDDIISDSLVSDEDLSDDQLIEHLEMELAEAQLKEHLLEDKVAHLTLQLKEHTNRKETRSDLKFNNFIHSISFDGHTVNDVFFSTVNSFLSLHTLQHSIPSYDISTERDKATQLAFTYTMQFLVQNQLQYIEYLKSYSKYDPLYQLMKKIPLFVGSESKVRNYT